MLNRGAAAEHDEVGDGDLLAARCRAVEGSLHTLEGRDDLGELGRLVDLPVLLGGEPDAATVGTAALVGATEGRGRGPGRGDELGDREAGGEDAGLEAGNVCGVDGGVVGGRDRVLPDEDLRRDLRAEVEGAGAHVAVGQLEPGAGEGVGELVRVGQEAARDGLVDGVEPKREVGRGHHGRMLHRRVMRVGDHVLRLAVLGAPLVGARGALHKLPLVAEEGLKVAVVPGGGVGLPGTLDTAGDGVDALARLVAAEPAEAHGLDGRAFRLGANMGRVAGAVRLAEGVATGHEGNGLFVVHRHAGEGLTHVAARGDRVGVAVRALRVDVDEAHLDGCERVLKVTLTAVAIVLEPSAFRTPVDVLLGLPDVDAAAGKAEGIEAHRLERHVAGKDVEVTPGDAVAVLLLDGPEEAAGLVEVAVVGPAVERREAEGAGAGAATTVGRAVGAGSVPGHADHEAAVVAPVGRPPGLAIGHEGREVLLHRGEVELAEGLGVVEVGAQRVGRNGVLVKNLQVNLVGPPVTVGTATNGLLPENRALAFALHHHTSNQTGRERAVGARNERCVPVCSGALSTPTPVRDEYNVGICAIGCGYHTGVCGDARWGWDGAPPYERRLLHAALAVEGNLGLVQALLFATAAQG